MLHSAAERSALQGRGARTRQCTPVATPTAWPVTCMKDLTNMCTHNSTAKERPHSECKPRGFVRASCRQLMALHDVPLLVGLGALESAIRASRRTTRSSTRQSAGQQRGDACAQAAAEAGSATVLQASAIGVSEADLTDGVRAPWARLVQCCFVIACECASAARCC